MSNYKGSEVLEKLDRQLDDTLLCEWDPDLCSDDATYKAIGSCGCMFLLCADCITACEDEFHMEGFLTAYCNQCHETVTPPKILPLPVEWGADAGHN